MSVRQVRECPGGGVPAPGSLWRLLSCTGVRSSGPRPIAANEAVRGGGAGCKALQGENFGTPLNTETRCAVRHQVNRSGRRAPKKLDALLVDEFSRPPST